MVGGDQDHDDGFELLTAADIVEWVRPPTLVRTQCSATNTGCRFNSVLDFVFTANAPASWSATSEILVIQGDFPDDDTNSDHRQVIGRFTADPVIPAGQRRVQLLARIAALEQEIAALRALVEQLP